MTSEGSRKYLYLSVCTGNCLALAAGLSMAWSSPVLPKLQDKQNLDTNPVGRLITAEEASWIGSLLPLGGIFGPWVAGFVNAKIGRKKSLFMCCTLPFVLAYLVLAFAKDVFVYYICRFVVGFGVGSVYTIIPLYNGEVAEVSIRGFICSSITTFEATGELISYCIGPYITIFWFCIGIMCWTTVSTILIVFIVPESPHYLMSVNDKEKAEKALMQLRSNTKDNVQPELEFIETLISESNANKATCIDILRHKGLRRALLIALGIITFQTCSGIFPVLLYAQTIFEETGSSFSPEISSMLIGLVQCLSSFITPNLVDVLGRRWMLIISAVGMCISEIFLALYFTWKSMGRDVTIYYWLPVTCLVVYMIFYIMGFGPLPWTIIGEIFPPNIKAIASTLSICTFWTWGFTISKSFISISEVLGPQGCFWIFSGSCFLAIFFVCIVVIETKGKNFQEIQDILNK